MLVLFSVGHPSEHVVSMVLACCFCSGVRNWRLLSLVMVSSGWVDGWRGMSKKGESSQMYGENGEGNEGNGEGNGGVWKEKEGRRKGGLAPFYAFFHTM